MGFLFCLACAASVEENAFGDWESAKGSVCPKRQGGHLVEQVVPEPEESA
ncbi:hypothetical protein ACFYUV_11315 [Nonomuraea sp. NPDC003560]